MIPTLNNQEMVWQLLEEIADPEVPVLSIVDLGIIRNVSIENNCHVTVTITPTYSGCPAMDVISMQIRMLLRSHGYEQVSIEMQLNPAWTTDWMSENGKVKLQQYGIAPPLRKSNESLPLFEEDLPACPKCNAINTSLVSRFGSTSCKAMYKCNECLEPFEHFKCH